MTKPDDGLLAACSACAAHARDLLESAKLVQTSGRPHIAYHLATLALEEMGRRELYQMHATDATVGDVPPWQMKATQDHVKKLFWCFYGMGRVQDIVDLQQFFEKKEAAADIHAIRLTGLYVENTDTGLNIPSKAISSDRSQALISLADSLVTYAEGEKPRENIPQEEVDLQRWFLKAFDNPEIRNRLIARQSLEKLKMLNDVVAWTRELKSEIEATEAELKVLAEKEIQRPPESLGSGQKNRWEIQLRIRTPSNVIRSRPLKKWNERMRWIKFRQQQGALKNEELIAEILIGDNVPVTGVWPIGMNLSFHLIVGLNLATSGFWWWPLPPYQQKFYEKVRDLEKNLEIQLETPAFKVWNQTADLTDVHVDNLIQCMAALPGPHDQQRAPAYTYYLGGLTFISLNSIQWRCEGQAFGNFLESFKLLMVEAEYIEQSETTDAAVGRFIKEKYPDLDAPEHEVLLELIRTFERRVGVPVVKIGDVYFMKLLCETIFRDTIVSSVLRRRRDKTEAN